MQTHPCAGLVPTHMDGGYQVPVLILVIILIVAPFSHAEERVSADNDHAYSAFSSDQHRQFDFWIGEWDVNLRIINDDLVFEDRIQAHASIYSILHGKAILELWDSQPIKGYSLRYYDPRQDQWILWLNWPSENRSSLSSLTGQFRHGRGEFFSEYQNADGETITQRYAFNDITPFSLRWDDLTSKDGGKTWWKSWRMEFTRTAVEPSWPLESKYFPTYDTGARCDAEEFQPYTNLAGHWHGKINGARASLSSWHVLDGCGVIAFLDIDSRPARKRFMFLTYDTSNQQWETSYLDDDRDSGLKRFTSKDSWTRTADGDQSLHWTVMDGELHYSFIGADAEKESGRFVRQELIGH